MKNNLSKINEMATRDVMDVYIFDENEKLQASLECLLHSKIYQENINGVEKCFLVLDSQIYNVDFLNYIYGKTAESDYKRYLDDFTSHRFSVNCKPVNVQCKLIATGYFKDTEGNIIDYVINASKAIIRTGISINSGNYEVNPYDIVIEIKPDANDNFYDMHLLVKK